MNTCLVCGEQQCSELHNFGEPAICHHFFDGTLVEQTHPLVLGQCESCATVQSLTPIPPEKLIPRFDWITYNEPEAHLDALAEKLCKLPGITQQSVVAGISYKEDTTLRRFQERGFHQTWRINPKTDLDISNPNAGVEMIQAQILPSIVPKLLKKYPQPDILIVRHMLEHTHDTLGFMRALRDVVKPTGYVIFEVPDCARAFDMFDYTTLWEDHALYFVEPTFLHCMRSGEFSIFHFERYRAAYENCLVAITRPESIGHSSGIKSTDMQIEHSRALTFARGFDNRRAEIRNLLQSWRKLGKIAVFGAGHQSAMFLNLMKVADLIEFVVDDHPRKCGLRMPGSRLPIVASESLMRDNIKLCLMSLSAESEKKVVQKHTDFVDKGGTFASIYPITKDSLLNQVAGVNQFK